MARGCIFRHLSTIQNNTNNIRTDKQQAVWRMAMGLKKYNKLME